MNMVKRITGFFETHKKILIIIGAALLVLIIGVSVVLPIFKHNNKNELQTEVGTVTAGSITTTVDSYGTLEAQPSTTLVWNSKGVIEEFNLKIGDKVKAGDVLMELKQSSQDSDILNAYNDLLDAENSLNELTASDSKYQSALSDLEYQQQMLINKKADKMAWDYGHSSMERIDAVRDNYYAARAAVWDLEDAYNAVKSLDENDPKRVEAYEALQAGIVKRDSLKRALSQILGIPFDIAVETDFIEYDQQAATVAEAQVTYNRYVDSNQEISAAQAKVQSLQNEVNKAKIIAPFDGTVTSISAVAGDVVANQAEAVRIDDLDNLIITVNVSQEDVNRVEVGQDVNITFDPISNKDYTGFVEAVSSSGQTDSHNIVYYPVTIKVEDADENVKTGFSAIVNIIVDSTEQGLLVPSDAVTKQSDGTYSVTLIGSNGKRETVPVEVVAESDTQTQITSDKIKEGDNVAVYTTATTNENNPMTNRKSRGIFGMMGGGGGGPR